MHLVPTGVGRWRGHRHSISPRMSFTNAVAGHSTKFEKKEYNNNNNNNNNNNDNNNNNNNDDDDDDDK